VWNLRAAYNVAALNCNGPAYVEIADNYRAFLKSHAKPLARANAGVDATFKAKYGAKDYIRTRETYMTQVYNYFAYPPTLTHFCDAALVMSRESAAIKAADCPIFPSAALPIFRASMKTSIAPMNNTVSNWPNGRPSMAPRRAKAQPRHQLTWAWEGRDFSGLTKFSLPTPWRFR
jgi:hypothetical protein